MGLGPKTVLVLGFDRSGPFRTHLSDLRLFNSLPTPTGALAPRTLATLTGTSIAGTGLC